MDKSLIQRMEKSAASATALLRKAGQYDESKHPRNPKGSGRSAGKFAPKGGAAGTRVRGSESRLPDFSGVILKLEDSINTRTAAYERRARESNNVLGGRPYWAGEATHRAEIDRKTDVLQALRSGNAATIRKAWRNAGQRTRMDSIFNSVRSDLDALSDTKSRWPDPDVVVTW